MTLDVQVWGLFKISDFAIDRSCDEHKSEDGALSAGICAMKTYFHRKIGKDRNADIRVSRVQTQYKKFTMELQVKQIPQIDNNAVKLVVSSPGLNLTARLG